MTIQDESPEMRDYLKWRKRAEGAEKDKARLLEKINELNADIRDLTAENVQLHAIVDGLEEPHISDKPYVLHTPVTIHHSDKPELQVNTDEPYILHNLDDFPYTYTTKA